MSKLLIVLFLSCMLSSCNGDASKSNKKKETETEPVVLRHAREFSIGKSADHMELKVHRKGEQGGYDIFKLVKTEAEAQGVLNTIKVPAQKIICLSSTQLTYFFALDDIDDIVAINSSRYLRHEGMRERVESGLVKKIGKEGSFNLETIAALDPDVIFVSPFKVGGFDVLRSLGIPLVPMAAYNEETPLGRAEWIKMISLFVGKEEKADSIFEGIETSYERLKALTAHVKKRPTVFSGKMRSGSWYVPGGNSFYAHYFRDAGADYFIKDDKQGAYPLDFETVYHKASECDYWRIIHPEKSGLTLNDLKKQDPRYADFKAFKAKNVLLCNIREKPYYEQVGMMPDVLLADYIHYFHPELLPHHTPYFYEKLR